MNISRYELGQLIEAMREGLEQKPRRTTIYHTKKALAFLEALRGLLDEHAQLKHTAELYAALVTDYNELYELARERYDIEVYQPAGEGAWIWDRRNGRRGSETTPAAALFAAIADGVRGAD